jgi:sporulation protein YlmC with PRC-barrel domain
MQISDGDLRARTVIGADGNAIGEVAGFLLDGETWSVHALRVRLKPSVAEQIGAPHSLFRASAVDVPVRLIQSVGDAVVLAIPSAELRQVLPGATEAATTSPSP